MWHYLRDKKEVIGLVIALSAIGWYARAEWDRINEMPDKVKSHVVDTVFILLKPIGEHIEEWQVSEKMEEGRFMGREEKDQEQDSRLSFLEKSVAKRDRLFKKEMERQEMIRVALRKQDSLRRFRQPVRRMSANIATAMVNAASTPDSVSIEIEETKPIQKKGLNIFRRNQD